MSGLINKKFLESTIPEARPTGTPAWTGRAGAGKP